MIGTRKLPPAASTGSGPIDRNDSLYGTLWIVGACLAALATLWLPGCSNPSSAHAVDAPQARDALKIALDEWKKGESPKSLETSSTPMVVQDLDWAAGAKLLDYEIVGDGQPQDANLHIQVSLKMNGGMGVGKPVQGKTAEKKVWYLVTTSPKVTVFRDMLKR